MLSSAVPNMRMSTPLGLDVGTLTNTLPAKSNTQGLEVSNFMLSARSLVILGQNTLDPFHKTNNTLFCSV